MGFVFGSLPLNWLNFAFKPKKKNQKLFLFQLPSYTMHYPQHSFNQGLDKGPSLAKVIRSLEKTHYCLASLLDFKIFTFHIVRHRVIVYI